MNIKEHIKNLLYTNQDVVIPGLGAFISEYESAVFDVNENKFLPPSKRIIFKQEYAFKDHLLIEYISKKENIDKDSARKYVSDFANESKNFLIKGDKIDFEGVGILMQNAKGEIVFEQDKNFNLLSESFGLQSIKSKPIENNPEKVIQARIKKRSYKKLIVIGSSIVIVLAIAIVGWIITDGYSQFDNLLPQKEITQEEEINLGLINTEKNLDSLAKADSIKALINETIDETTDKKDALFYQQTKKEEAKSKYSSFQIIAGSFTKLENANKFADELKNKGLNPEIITKGENLYRISIFTFTDETEALKELYKLRETSDIKSVWILKSN